MQYSFGPLVDASGTLFRLWAPSQAAVSVVVDDRAPHQLSRDDHGMWSGRVEGVGGGARYMFEINGKRIPDPASREQADAADGWSVVRPGFKRRPLPGPVRPWHEAILCEVHVGTVTPEGTFAALMQRLEHFRDAGYTGLELMPVNEFPGARGWGYDGTLLFAPSRAYGTPDDLRALVERAHQLGLSMTLDVVYNHFGAIDNFIADYAPEFFDDSISTPWGAAVNFRQPLVRKFYYENVCNWLLEYDFDGIRFDAIHEIATEARDLFLGELARAARVAKPGVFLVVENEHNNAHWLTRTSADTPVDFTAQWNDDVSHVLAFLTLDSDRSTYGKDGEDPIADLEKALADGFSRDGDVGQKSDGRTRNEPASKLPLEAFVAFWQNHDQIGNRPDGKRIVDHLDAERLDFGHFVLLLNPQIPMFFMGEEGHLKTEFTYFFDMPEPFASTARDDRYTQMSEVFGEAAEPGQLPDPQDPKTFMDIKLDWADFERPEHSEALDRFRHLTALRRELIWPLTATRCLNSWSARQGDGIIVTWQYQSGMLNMVLNPNPTAATMNLSMGYPAASTGSFIRHDSVVEMGPWSAVVWRS